MELRERQQYRTIEKNIYRTVDYRTTELHKCRTIQQPYYRNYRTTELQNRIPIELLAIPMIVMKFAFQQHATCFTAPIAQLIRVSVSQFVTARISGKPRDPQFLSITPRPQFLSILAAPTVGVGSPFCLKLNLHIQSSLFFPCCGAHLALLVRLFTIPAKLTRALMGAIRNYRTIEPWNCRSDRPIELQNDITNYRTIELQNYRAIELSNYRAIELQNYRTIELQNYRTVELQNCGTVELQNCRTIELQNCIINWLTVELQNCRTVKM